MPVRLSALHYMEGCALEGKICGKFSFLCQHYGNECCCPPPSPVVCTHDLRALGRGWLPSGHELDAVGPKEQWMCPNCGAGVVCGMPHCSDPSPPEGGDTLVSDAGLLPKEAMIREMGKTVGKWEAASRLTLVTQPCPVRDHPVLRESALGGCTCMVPHLQ